MPDQSPPPANAAHATAAWIDAFNAHDADRIARLYDPAAVLWGTLSPTIITSASGVRGYFERAFASRPAPKMSLQSAHDRAWGDTAVVSGTYRLALWQDGRAQTLPARFSFTYRRANGGWLIVDHHSSLMPTPPDG